MVGLCKEGCGGKGRIHMMLCIRCRQSDVSDSRRHFSLVAAPRETLRMRLTNSLSMVEPYLRGVEEEQEQEEGVALPQT